MSVDEILPTSEGASFQPKREIRASFTDETIRVYQAYPSAIADPAVAAQRFVPPFSLARMTWIKPSFFWTMYRSSWATKVGQERVLAIDITRDGFEWALNHSCLSHFDANIHESSEAWKKLVQEAAVRVQWDPERNYQLARLDYRSLQVGLSGEAAELYVSEWIRCITDVTRLVHDLRELDISQRESASRCITNEERSYPLPQRLALQIGIVTKTFAPGNVAEDER